MTNNELLLAITNLIQPIADDVRELKKAVHRLEERMDRLEERMERLEERMDRLEERMDRLEERMDKAEEHIFNIELMNENIMLPRLQTIEKCYTDTYHRYQESVDGYDRMKDDIKTIREVVLEHSRKMQKIPQFA